MQNPMKPKLARFILHYINGPILQLLWTTQSSVKITENNDNSSPSSYAIFTCEIKLFRKNLKFISVFYVTCNHSSWLHLK